MVSSGGKIKIGGRRLRTPAFTKRYRESIGKFEPRDLSTALRNVAVSKGIAADKAAQLRGPPVERAPATVENFNALLVQIERLCGGAIRRVPSEAVEGSAAELPAADPPDGPEG